MEKCWSKCLRNVACPFWTHAVACQTDSTTQPRHPPSRNGSTHTGTAPATHTHSPSTQPLATANEHWRRSAVSTTTGCTYPTPARHLASHTGIDMPPMPASFWRMINHLDGPLRHRLNVNAALATPGPAATASHTPQPHSMTPSTRTAASGAQAKMSLGVPWQCLPPLQGRCCYPPD